MPIIWKQVVPVSTQVVPNNRKEVVPNNRKEVVPNNRKTVVPNNRNLGLSFEVARRGAH